MIRFALAHALHCITLCGLLAFQVSTAAASNLDSLSDARIKRTTQMATILPGSGQIMNGKWWKAPIVWGGLAYCVSAIQFNATELNSARREWIELEESDPASIQNYNELLLFAKEQEQFYRRQRDLSWFALAGVHLLGILDAHVDANLLAFDVSDDLSLAFHFAPLPLPQSKGGWSVVLHWELNQSKLPKFTRSKSARWN